MELGDWPFRPPKQRFNNTKKNRLTWQGNALPRVPCPPISSSPVMPVTEQGLFFANCSDRLTHETGLGDDTKLVVIDQMEREVPCTV